MAGTSSPPITYSTDSRMVQPLDWNAAWAWLKANYIVASSIATIYLKVDQSTPQVTVGTFVFPTVGTLLLSSGNVTANSVTSTLLRSGDATNGADIVNGVLTLNGTAKRHLSMRPYIEQGSIAGVGKPSIVTRGATKGYSMPIFNNDNEEIFVNEYIAGRWDAASDIVLSLIGYLDSAEDVGDVFKLQCSWMNKSNSSGVVSDSVTDVAVTTSVATDRNIQYSIYKIDFTIDWDLPAVDLAPSDFFAARIRRLAVDAGNEISGEFVITQVMIQYQVDKMYKA